MFKRLKRVFKKIYKKLTKRDFLVKAAIIASSLALVGTAILPYIVR